MTSHIKLNLSMRTQIETLLNANHSFSQIADALNVSVSTISREVKNHLLMKDTLCPGSNGNRCANRKSCSMSSLCPSSRVRCFNKRCSSCRKQLCSSICNDYIEEHCSLLDKPPYVCNACPKRGRCPLKKVFYSAFEANNTATTTRKEARSGFNLTEQEINDIDILISDRIKKGQSIHHIFASSEDCFPISERMAYKLIDAGLISARPIDMPRKVRMKPRKSKSKEGKVDKACRLNRTYQDYLKYIEEHPDEQILECDTVEGVKGGKCLLTLAWPQWKFQIGILRERNDSASFTAIIKSFYERLGDELFHKVFPSIWICDNGKEFSNPCVIEQYGIKVFYCDPSAPYQKPFCENNHEQIRRVIPKGTTFDDLDQEFFDLLFSHINSLQRKKLNNHSAFEMFSSSLEDGINLEDIFHIKNIEPNKLELTPSLKFNYLSNKIK